MEQNTTPQSQPAAEVKPAPAEACKCPDVKAEDWDKKKTKLEKTFYKTFSPRAFYYPFSFAIDLFRATKGAEKAGYKIPENPMILDTGGMFLSTLLVEVQGAKAEDKNVVSLAGKELYTKVSTKPWKEIKADIEELKQELGKEPSELYFWYTACPKCAEKKAVKTVLIAMVKKIEPAAAPPAKTPPPQTPPILPTPPPASPSPTKISPPPATTPPSQPSQPLPPPQTPPAPPTAKTPATKPTPPSAPPKKQP